VIREIVVDRGWGFGCRRRGNRRRLRDRRRSVDLLGAIDLPITRTASHFYAAEEHNHDHRGRHDEQEDKLFTAQLDFMESVVGPVVCEFGHC
jgi:hypothetical protein